MRYSWTALLLLPLLVTGQESFDRLTHFSAPSPLAKDAVTTDWPRFLGPSDDASTTEKPLLKDFTSGGPKLLWRVDTGEGYTSPAIAGGRLVIFHALEGRETVECLHPESGRRFWSFDYPISYQDRYGFGNGPRGSPVIAEGVVVVLGVTSMLHALDLKTGRELWRRDLRKDYNVPQDFFGHGSSPLITLGKVIVQVGGKEEPFDSFEDKRERARKLASKGVSVAAFDLKTGSVVWKVEDEWGASYASPTLAEIHGKTKVLVFAGGESDPPTGGLMCMDPETGALHDRFPWRADDYISATASNPVVIPGMNRVFVTTCYPKNRPLGGVMVEYDTDFKAREVWRSSKIGVHWMTPVHHEGHIYAVDGERENNSRLVCVNAATGGEVWEKNLEWEDAALAQAQGRSNPVRLSILRANLLRCGEDFLCLGETGSLHWLRMSAAGLEESARTQLFYALNTWSMPVVSRGLLYVRQHERSLDRKSGPALLCYDLRG
ncbi:MAG TPA: PQQ-binding-like beta-propeller repeat protein [Prosthecobacter sp.]|nr:PQQ-binding-like beta-propeller repeat protein [Prosthecobacter sp.]HRK17008.1 PQQ-binding-like beta-propeller repeat protein [Prosthecobacter sp.]